MLETTATATKRKYAPRITKERFNSYKRHIKELKEINPKLKNVTLPETLGISGATLSRIMAAENYKEYQKIIRNNNVYVKQSVKTKTTTVVAESNPTQGITQADLDAQAAMILSGVQDMLQEFANNNKSKGLFSRK